MRTKFFSYILCGLTTILTFSATKTVQADQLNIYVDVWEHTYAGVYSGSTNNGVPSGSGTFTHTTDSQVDLTLSGEWKKGSLVGSARINYSDGTTVETVYDKGLISGTSLITSTDGSTTTFESENGIPYGLITTTASDGSLSYDYFYDKEPISELKSDAVSTFNYSDLLSLTPESLISTLEITGEVQQVLEDDIYRYLVILDSSDHLYVAKYSHDLQSQYAQAIVPEVEVGDVLTIYGNIVACKQLSQIDNLATPVFWSDAPASRQYIIISSSDSLSEQSGSLTENADNLSKIMSANNPLHASNSTLPILNIFYAEIKGDSLLDISSVSASYSNIRKYPYHFAEHPLQQDVVVIASVIDYEEGIVELLVATDSKNEEVYYTTLDIDELTSIPAVNDIISLNGFYNGTHKVQFSRSKAVLSYVYYPAIKASIS